MLKKTEIDNLSTCNEGVEPTLMNNSMHVYRGYPLFTTIATVSTPTNNMQLNNYPIYQPQLGTAGNEGDSSRNVPKIQNWSCLGKGHAGNSRRTFSKHPEIDRKRPSRLKPILPRSTRISRLGHPTNGPISPKPEIHQSYLPIISVESGSQDEVDGNINRSCLPKMNKVADISFYSSPNPTAAFSKDMNLQLTRRAPSDIHQDIEHVESPSLSSLNVNALQYYNVCPDVSSVSPNVSLTDYNVKLTSKGERTINSVMNQSTCRPSRYSRGNFGTVDILQAAEYVCPTQFKHSDVPYLVKEQRRPEKSHIINSNSSILDIADSCIERRSGNISCSQSGNSQDFMEGPTTSTRTMNDSNFSSTDSSNSLVGEKRIDSLINLCCELEKNSQEDNFNLKRRVSSNLPRLPNRKNISRTVRAEKDEYCINVGDLMEMTAIQSGSQVNHRINRRATDKKDKKITQNQRLSKHRGGDETIEIMRRFPPTFIQDLFEDVSTLGHSSYIDAYAAAMEMNEDPM